MKLLFASRGNTLDSMIERDEEKTKWYLVVDTATGDVTPVRAIGQPLPDVLAGASAHGITVFLTGSRGPHSKVTVTPGMIVASFAEEITVKEALERWQHGRLRLFNPSRETRRHARVVREGPDVKMRRLYNAADVKGISAKKTPPRVQHHLQQYAGRGH